MATKLDLADAQFLGFREGRYGTGVIGLVTSMGLTKAEWVKLKSDYNCSGLTESEVREIDEYFNLK